MKKNSLFKSSLFWIVIFLLIMGAIYFISGGGNSSSSISKIQSSQLVSKMKNKHVGRLTIKPSGSVYSVEGFYRRPHQVTSNANLTGKSTRVVRGFKTYELKGNVNKVNKIAHTHHIRVNVLTDANSGSIWTSLLPLLITMLPIILIFIFIMYIMNKAGAGGGKLLRFGKKNIKPVKDTKVRFKDVAGEDAEKQELVEIVDFLKNPKKYTKLGANIPHGVLLEGPPGTGKTLLAKAVAGEANVPFYYTSGSSFVQMFVGVGASRVRNLFRNAKQHSPSIIFIDEIDAVGRKRGSSAAGGDEEREQTLNQLLTEMDGFSSNDNVVVIAATNRADVLDNALTRPGRFDRKVLVGRPDVRGRYAILKVHAKGKPFDKRVDLKEIARQTPGFVGADLANLLNEASLLGARFNHKKIMPKDVSEAEDRVIAGPAKKNAVISPNERRVVADHEAGHTIVGLVLTNARVVHKVTIIPRGRAGGYTIMLPKEDQNLMTKRGALQQLAGLLGGRTAEEIIYHAKSSGASSDFKQATKLARAMVTIYGMSNKLGDVQLESPYQSPYDQPKYSEHTATLIDQEVKHFIDHAHRVAYKVIQTHRAQHHVIAKALLKYETLDAKEIQSLYKTGHMPKGDTKIAD